MEDVDIRMSEYLNKSTELNSLGVHSVVDVCLARVTGGLRQLQGFELKNTGKGLVTFTLKKRGKSYTVAAQNISALQVGATDRIRGALGIRRITPKTVVILDTNVGTPQRVEDKNGDGILCQTNGPAGPTYPLEVGTIN